MFIKKIARLIVALNSNVRAGQLAAGCAFGLLLGLVPSGNLLWILLFLLVSFVKIHHGMFLLTTAILKLVLLPLQGPLDGLGWMILNLESLRGSFTALYNMPIAPLTRFNSTLVMGGLAAGLALWLPVFLAMLAFVGFYRKRLAPRIAKSKLFAAFKKLPLINSLVQAIDKASDLAGALS